MVHRFKFSCALAALLVAAPASAQVLTPPAPGEFGSLAEVSDGLNDAGIAALLEPHSTHTTGDGAAETEGSFRFICEAGQVLADDPIVYPGQPKKSHAHQFYGNLATDANTTYAGGRTNGLTTCTNMLNRSHYWMPAMLNGNGEVVRPDYIAIYYKRKAKFQAECDPTNVKFIGQCVGLPNGLRFIFGVDMVTGTIPTGEIKFKCVEPGDVSHTERADIVAAAADCVASNAHLALTIIAPDCWDGNNLDSPNHRSHLANKIIDPVTGNPKCPSTHPKFIPHFQLTAFWLIDATLNRTGSWSIGQNTWYLSSDVMYGKPQQRPGSTFHADYFEGWNNKVKKAWTDNCIDRQLNCSGADLGNGYQMKQVYPLDMIATPRIVTRPAMAMEPFKVHVGPH